MTETDLKEEVQVRKEKVIGRRDESRGRKRETKKQESNDNRSGCFRCGSQNHRANKCPIYKSRSLSMCRDCKLDHKTSECKTPKHTSNHTEAKIENLDK